MRDLVAFVSSVRTIKVFCRVFVVHIKNPESWFSPKFGMTRIYTLFYPNRSLGIGLFIGFICCRRGNFNFRRCWCFCCGNG